MKMKKPKILSTLPVVFTCAFGAALLVEPQAAVEGMRAGLKLCAGVAVPSLFPFLIVSSFMALVPLGGITGRVLEKLTALLFRLPGAACTAVVFGLIGGYPVGCSAAAQLYEKGLLTREQAQRCTLFCVNPGPAFVITAVGTVMLGNRRAGLILFCSLCISSLIIGFVLRFTGSGEAPAAAHEKAVSFSAALVESTEKSTFAMLKICAWVTLFSCLNSLVAAAGLPVGAVTALGCVLEVTNGCSAAAAGGNLFMLAAALGWSGLCVFCQVLEHVRRVGTSTAVFLAFRAVNAGLAAVVCKGLLNLFPAEQAAFSSFTGAATAQAFSVSLPAALALFALCIVFIIDLDRCRKMC